MDHFAGLDVSVNETCVCIVHHPAMLGGAARFKMVVVRAVGLVRWMIKAQPLHVCFGPISCSTEYRNRLVVLMQPCTNERILAASVRVLGAVLWRSYQFES